MIVMIDNYDSFTYNLVQYLMELGADMKVIRNNKITIPELKVLEPTGIVISPGPGRPESSGISPAVVKEFSGSVPILGVCLGHQTIAQVFGAEIVGAGKLMHGKVSKITTDGKSLFKGIGESFIGMRYHSLAVLKESIPDCLEITAETEDGEIMGLRHVEHRTEGFQFHPESIMTSVGKKLLSNFLKISKGGKYVS